MTVTTKIQKWGNSLAVRLPRGLIRSVALKEGSEVSVYERDKELVIAPRPRADKPYRLADWNKFIIPTKRKKNTSTASKEVDHILYGVSR